MTPIALSPPSPEESLPSSPTLAPLKRKHSALEDPTTPPLAIEEDAEKASIIARATHVLATEATALSHVSRLYQTDRCAQKGLLRAVETIVDVNTKKGGKLVVCGVGKSGLVGMKTVATMKSLGLAASWMHAGEAMHGDLGDLRDNDALLLLTFSGRTPELAALLPHLPAAVPLIVLTSHTSLRICPLPLLDRRPNTAILLPGPIHESEEESFGVSAPTTSTTVAMAIGDMLALTAAERIHVEKGRTTREVFARNHPGGTIGKRLRREKEEQEEGNNLVRIGTPLSVGGC